MTQEDREHAVRVLRDIKNREYEQIETDENLHKALQTALTALREPKPDSVTITLPDKGGKQITQVEREHAARVLQEFFDFNKTLTPQSDLWLQADITINRYTQKELGKALPAAIAALREPLGTAETCTVEQAKDAPWINVNDRLPDNARWVLGARRDDDVREMRYRRNGMQSYWDKPSIDSADPIYWREMPEVPQEKEWSGALDGTDAADRLRWLLSQAERVVTVDAKDRRAVTLACDALEGRIDVAPGFDAVRK